MHLPESYRDARYAPRQYPVMYLLDGDSSFHFATGTVHFMSEGLTGSTQIPELIVVPVPNTDRTRDLTGGRRPGPDVRAGVKSWCAPNP